MVTAGRRLLLLPTVLAIAGSTGCGASHPCHPTVIRVGESGPVRLLVSKEHDGLTTIFAGKTWFLRIPSPDPASGMATVIKQRKGGALVLDVETEDGRELVLSPVTAC